MYKTHADLICLLVYVYYRNNYLLYILEGIISSRDEYSGLVSCLKR